MWKFRVLVVDDYEPFCRIVRSVLEKTNFHVVEEASDGVEALQKAEELKPDLVLLDIGLPRLNGIETARRLREIAPETEILFVSQESDAEIVQEALSLKRSGYVLKARVGKELLPAICSVLRVKQFVREWEADNAVGEQAKSNTAFVFEFDSDSKIFQGRFNGPVTFESANAFYRATSELLKGIDFRGSITDMSGVTWSDLTPDAIRELAALPPLVGPALPPSVIVTPSALISCLARTFRILGKATRPNLRIARSQTEALALLGVDRPRFRPIERTTH